MWNDYYILWNYAAVSITDIRYMELEAYEMKYKFPTSTFVLTFQGEAGVMIDNQTYEVSRFYVLHGGKGSKLVIQAGEAGLRLYYLMYKANLPSGGRNDLGRLIKEILMKDQLVEVSSEAIPEFAGDYIILTADNLTLEELKSKPVWSSLDAVKNDRVFIWSPDRSWYFDPIATLDQTEELAAWFTKISEQK